MKNKIFMRLKILFRQWVGYFVPLSFYPIELHFSKLLSPPVHFSNPIVRIKMKSSVIKYIYCFLAITFKYHLPSYTLDSSSAAWPLAINNACSSLSIALLTLYPIVWPAPMYAPFQSRRIHPPLLWMFWFW